MVAHTSTARLQSDPYRHIRPVKGGKWQARPYDEGERFNLGIFPSRDAAAAAVREFWWGKRPDRPRFVTPVHHRDGTTTYRVRIPFPKRVDDLGEFPTAALASAAACAHVRRVAGLFADAVLRRK